MTTTSYTPDGLVAKVVRPDQTVNYTYDAAGNRLTMKDKVGTSSWAYAWAGRAVSETDARGKTTRHAYDLAGNLAGILYPDGRSVARTFDARGLAVTQTDTTAAGASSVTTFAYDENGAMSGQVRPSGLTTGIERDLAGRVTSIDYTGLGVTGNPLPSGVVNPSSAAPGNAYGHCKDNGNGHPNQQPAGCTTGSLSFAYAYDERGLISQRDVTTGSTAADAVTTETEYTHDPLGRLSRSVTGGAATIYAWDAASNLVGEGGTDDPSTAKVGDAYAIARTVDPANELVTLVKTPVGTPGGKVATTQFTYDERGNRTGAVTTTQTGNRTHVESTSTYVYDSMDQLTSTTGLEGSASFVRDGVGRALTVTEDGVTSNRLYDGFTVVADGATQLATAPNGQVLGETTTTTTTKGKTTTTAVASVDVLTDALGSAVATASDGVISADLALFGDFGDLLTARKPATSATATVTGFTGKTTTAGFVEFATRTYDPTTRQWVQDDRYRGTTTRAASMNRYAYVEGAPESFVDELGFYRARAAIQAQKFAAVQAANEAAAKARAAVAPKCSGYACYSLWLNKQAMNAKYAQMYGPPAPGRISASELYQHGVWVAAEKERVRAREQAKIDAYNKSQDKGYLGGFVDTLSIAGWGLANVGIGIVNTPSALVNSFGCFYEITCDKYQTRWGEITVPNQAAWGTIDAVGPSEYKWWQTDVGTDVGVLLIMVGTAKAGEKWGPNAVVSEARAAQLQGELSATSRGVSARLAEQAQISHGHISATPKGPLDSSGSYFTTIDDAKAVLAAYQAGDAEILGLSSGGDMVVVRVPSVTGYNQNVGSGYLNQPTDTFLIKGTTKVSVVPTTPGGPSDMSLVFIDLSTLAALSGQANWA